MEAGSSSNQDKSKYQSIQFITRRDFRQDVGEVADIISFANEFLKRYPSQTQKETLLAFGGEKGGEWNTEYYEILLEIGMKGGKNWVAEIIASYTAYFLNCLVNKFDYFSRLTKRPLPYSPDTMFDIVNVSVVDEKQAREVFFTHVVNAIKLTKDPRSRENWFAKYAKLDLRPGGFGDIKETKLEFPVEYEGQGTVRFLSFNSTKKAPEGLHMFLFFADELSRAETKATAKEAEGLYDLGLNNTASSFPNRIAKTIGWAYPNETDFDVTHNRYEIVKDLPHIYARRYKTWEFDTGKKKEMYEHLYKADPVKAARVFECIKPISKDNFYRPYVFKLKEAINPNIRNKVKYKHVTKIRSVFNKVTGELQKNEFSGVEILSIEGDRRERCWFYDMSKTKDLFWIGGGYLETIDPLKLDVFIEEEARNEIITTNKRPVIDVFIVIVPQANKPVDYLGVGDIFTALIKNFPNSVSANSDHYQNEKLRQELQKAGLIAETYFFSNANQVKLYTITRANVWNNNLEICQDDNEIVIGNRVTNATEIWLEEGEKLNKDGNKIDHPEGGSKDGQDTVAGLNHDLMKLEVSHSGNMNVLSEEKLRNLCAAYMEEKHRLIEEECPAELIEDKIAIKLNLQPKDAETLRKFVRENYNY